MRLEPGRMFFFRLAEHLSMTVSTLLCTATATEINDWQAYFYACRIEEREHAMIESVRSKASGKTNK